MFTLENAEIHLVKTISLTSRRDLKPTLQYCLQLWGQCAVTFEFELTPNRLLLNKTRTFPRKSVTSRDVDNFIPDHTRGSTKTRNPESGIRNPESGIRNPESGKQNRNPESRNRIRNPESGNRNPKETLRFSN